MRKMTNGWRIAYWLLLVGWVVGAALNMAKVRGGFLTNYLADLTFPPWFYITLRNKATKQPTVVKPARWFGETPLRAAVSIFLVGLVTEVSSYFWPRGAFGGTFDPLDIAAYGIGLLVCYWYDTRK